MSPRSQDPLILNREQLHCLAAPVKREIFEAMMRSGPVSVNVLAARLGRSPKSLYYHVRGLCGVGLVLIQETHVVAKRTETIYALTADRIVMQESEDTDYRQTAARSVSALLRRVDREFRAASEPRAGEINITEVTRSVIRMKPDAVEELRAMLAAAARFARENEDPDQGLRVALTMLLTTLPPRE